MRSLTRPLTTMPVQVAAKNYNCVVNVPTSEALTSKDTTTLTDRVTHMI
jgi:hypothetical protein